MGSTGGCERMIPMQFALRRRMMAGKDRQTWIYHNGKLLLPYTKFTNDRRDDIVIITTPNLKMKRVGYYSNAGVYFRTQINEKFVYNCIEKTYGFRDSINVASELNTTQLAGVEISNGEHTIFVNKPGLYYIVFYIFDYNHPITFSELFVI